MWKSKLKFLGAGFQTMIHDAGRMGHQAQGVPQGGFLDNRSAHIANRLVGNYDNHPILEITLKGPKIEVQGDIYIALTGGKISIDINGTQAKMYETIHVTKGSIISLGSIKSGARSYLAIGGDWEVDTWLGSTSPIPQISIKELENNQISKKSELTIKVNTLIKKKICPEHLKINKEPNQTIRVTKGPEFDLQSGKSMEYFFNENFSVHQNSNRMAISFQEKIPGFTNQNEMISSAVLPGTIQITNQGGPLILQNDAGTTGGYPRMANVINADLSKVAQLSAGQKINFELVTLEIANQALRIEKEMLLSFT